MQPLVLYRSKQAARQVTRVTSSAPSFGVCPACGACSVPMKSLWKPSRIFLRRYATRRPERPPPKLGDPLLEDPRAQVQQISDDLTFIYRPPPTAPTPLSTTLAPSSPLLKLIPASSKDVGKGELKATLPPSVRKPRQPPNYTILTQDDFTKMRELRASNPSLYTRSKLATMFNCSLWLVGQQASLSNQPLREALEKREKEHEQNRSKWGENKATVMAIRKKRRSYW